MCGWVADVATALTPIGEQLPREIIAVDYLQTDDTTITVLDEQRGSFKGRPWTYLDPLTKQVVFDAVTTYAGDGPAAFLADFHGALQADAYSGYGGLYQSGRVIEIGCWAHARRRFVEAFMIDTSAALMIALIQQLYQVEQGAADLDPEGRRALRQEQSVPLLAKIQCRAAGSNPNGLAEIALTNQWAALQRFIDDGRLAIDNNRAEKQLRIVAVGRNNWLFAGSFEGARRAALLYSIVQSCKLVDVAPFLYLKDVLLRIATHPQRHIDQGRLRTGPRLSVRSCPPDSTEHDWRQRSLAQAWPPIGGRRCSSNGYHRTRFTARAGVVMLGVAPEKIRAFKAHKRAGPGTKVTFDFSRQWVAVNQYFFYVHDRDWGPAFVKIGTYLPDPIKLCLTGHEWVTQQLRRKCLRFESLDNGFRSCPDLTGLETVCDALGPADVQAFFDRWPHRLPWPVTPADRAAGYDHRLAINQLEVSLTQVFDRPVQGRHLFEAVIREYLDLGRPDRVTLLFPLRLTRATPPLEFGYRTRVITDGVHPSLHVEYKHSHVKQYFKEHRALRTEVTINNPRDFWIRKGLSNLPHLREA